MSTKDERTSGEVTIRIARVAKSSEFALSFACSISELTHTSRTVRLLPFRLGSKIFVSVESRYGMCLCPAASALTTFPRASRLVLMFNASLNRAPTFCVFFCRSLPAKSTMVSSPRRFSTATSCAVPSSSSSSSRSTSASIGRSMRSIFI